MEKNTEQGVTFETCFDPVLQKRWVNAVDNEEGESVYRRTKIDAKTFLRLIDDHIRIHAVRTLEEHGASKRVERELERRIEVACKGVQGAIDKMVADEIERQVRARVQAYVATMPICFRLCDEKESNA